MKIGLVIAISKEFDAFKEKFGEPLEYIQEHNYQIMHFNNNDNDLYATQSSAGEIGAAATTQMLITKFDVEAIFNFGIVGGLHDDMKLHNICVVKDVVHYDFDTSGIDNCEVARYLELEDIHIPTSEELRNLAIKDLPDLYPVRCASGDKFVDYEDEKRRLYELYEADICDMESAGIALTCYRNDLPCLLIKMVSDSISGGPEEYLAQSKLTAKACVDLFAEILTQITA